MSFYKLAFSYKTSINTFGNINSLGVKRIGVDLEMPFSYFKAILTFPIFLYEDGGKL